MARSARMIGIGGEFTHPAAGSLALTVLKKAFLDYGIAWSI
jgi:hypothetical protein